MSCVIVARDVHRRPSLCKRSAMVVPITSVHYITHQGRHVEACQLHDSSEMHLRREACLSQKRHLGYQVTPAPGGGAGMRRCGPTKVVHARRRSQGHTREGSTRLSMAFADVCVLIMEARAGISAARSSRRIAQRGDRCTPL